MGRGKQEHPAHEHQCILLARFFSEEDMYDPAKNFDAGAFMLKRIAERLAPNDRTTRKIATLYNNINAKAVTDYGARVEYFTRTLRPDWLPVPPPSPAPSP